MTPLLTTLFATAFSRGGMRSTHLIRRAVASRTNAIVAAAGDVATVQYSLRPDMESRASTYGKNSDKLLESLPFDIGTVRFVVNEGGYLEGLHSTVSQMAAGDAKKDVSIDAGYGDYNEQGVVTAPIEQAPAGLKQGMAVMLSVPNGQVQATCTEMTDETLTLDTNHPLAGCRFLLDVELTNLEPADKFETAVFAGGCFWGLELAYQREPGVVSTAVGYTQGTRNEPTYEEVCSGSTGHTEAVQVKFDPEVVSYERLCKLLVERLEDNIYLLNQVGNDRGTQYRHGFYPESDEQEAVAKKILEAVGDHKSLGPVQSEVVKAKKFWMAEDYHRARRAPPKPVLSRSL